MFFSSSKVFLPPSPSKDASLPTAPLPTVSEYFLQMFVQEKSVRKKFPGWEQKHVIYSPSARVRLQISGDRETTSSCEQESKLNNSFHLVQERQTEWCYKGLLLSLCLMQKISVLKNPGLESYSEEKLRLFGQVINLQGGIIFASSGDWRKILLLINILTVHFMWCW